MAGRGGFAGKSTNLNIVFLFLVRLIVVVTVVFFVRSLLSFEDLGLCWDRLWLVGQDLVEGGQMSVMARSVRPILPKVVQRNV